MRHATLGEFLPLLVRHHSRATQPARHQPRKRELLVLVLDIGSFQLRLCFFEEFPCNKWLMFSGIPVATSGRVLKDTIEEWRLQQSIYVTQGERLIARRASEVHVELEPVINLSARPLFIRHFLKHLSHDRRSLGINNYLTLPIKSLFVQISSWCRRRPQPHFAAHPQPTLHVHALVIVLKFCLATKNHEKEFLIWRIVKVLSVRAYLKQELLIHKVHERPKVASVPAQSVRCPCKYARVSATPQIC